MPSAEIITIGTELLLGEIVDTNSQYLARQLRDAGIDIYWTTTVGDNLVRIAEAVRQGLQRSDIVVCTGGLGPTIDDMTREAIAKAAHVDLEYREELWKQIQERFARFGRKASENNQRQAFVPAGAVVLDNPVGSAPAFLVQSANGVVLSLPGVPGEMKRIWEDSALPYLMQKYGQSHVIRSRVLHSAGVGESLIDEKIADLEELANPTVGLAAHAGSVDIRLTAKAETDKVAQSMLDELEGQVRERLGDWVYGKDAETLTETILTALRRLGWTLVVVEAGFGGRLAAPFAGARDTLLGSTALEAGSGPAELGAAVARQMASQGAESGLGAVLSMEPEKLDLHLTFIEPQAEHQHRFRYGGALQSAEDWALNLAHSWLLQQLRKAGAAE
jgi:competence/damage-inducible protein CinA-like protein